MADTIRLEGAATGADVEEVTFIGNATVLLRLGGFTVLTDPNFLHAGMRAKLGGGLRSRRLKEPACAITDLPPLDLVVLSHHHGDHFDEVAARELDRDVPIVTTRHAARKLRRQGFRRPLPLGTWESVSAVRGEGELRITATPGTHGPAPLAAVLPPVMGSVLELSRGGEVGYRLYITGDTLVHDALRDVPRRHPRLDCALVHLGGTSLFGVLLTMDGDQGAELLRIVAPRHAVPIHVDDYTIQRSPLSDFTRAVDDASLPTQIHVLERGAATRLPR